MALSVCTSDPRIGHAYNDDRTLCFPAEDVCSRHVGALSNDKLHYKHICGQKDKHFHRLGPRLALRLQLALHRLLDDLLHHIPWTIQCTLSWKPANQAGLLYRRYDPALTVKEAVWKWTWKRASHLPRNMLLLWNRHSRNHPIYET